MITKITILIILIVLFAVSAINFLINIKDWKREWFFLLLVFTGCYLMGHCTIEFLKIIQWIR